jgi:hypothetical protein
MNANQVLIDLLEDNRRRLLRMLDTVPDDCLYWRPDAESNHIALTMWHMGRLFDIFFIQMGEGRPPEDDCWFRHGWAACTGYDPRGIGQNGWGMLTGFTVEEANQVPELSREEIISYLNQVYGEVRDYLASHDIEYLLNPCVGFEGKYSRYQCLQMALMDNIRHMGDIFTLKNRWLRESNQA